MSEEANGWEDGVEGLGDGGGRGGVRGNEGLRDVDGIGSGRGFEDGAEGLGRIGNAASWWSTGSVMAWSPSGGTSGPAFPPLGSKFPAMKKI